MKTITIFGIIIILVVAWLCGCTYTNKNNELVIEKFEVKPTVINRGETAVISWEVKGATSVTIDNGIGNVN